MFGFLKCNCVAPLHNLLAGVCLWLQTHTDAVSGVTPHPLMRSFGLMAVLHFFWNIFYLKLSLSIYFSILLCICCSVLALLEEGTTEEISVSLPWICRTEPNSCWTCIFQGPSGCGVCLMTKSEKITSGMARTGLSYHTVISCTLSHSQHGSASPGLLVLSAWRCAGGVEGQHGMSC